MYTFSKEKNIMNMRTISAVVFADHDVVVSDACGRTVTSATATVHFTNGGTMVFVR